MSAQRQQYKIRNTPEDPSKPKRSTPLSQARIDALNALGFTWSVRSRENPGDAWKSKFEPATLVKASRMDHSSGTDVNTTSLRDHSSGTGFPSTGHEDSILQEALQRAERI